MNRSIAAAEMLGVPLRPHALGSHNQHWDDGLAGALRHTHRTRLQILDFKAARDSRLRKDAYQLVVFQLCAGLFERLGAVGAVDRNVLTSTHDWSCDRMVEDFLLRHKTDKTAVLAEWKTDIGEVHVSGVVSNENGARVFRHVFPALNGELQTLGKEDGARQSDNR